MEKTRDLIYRFVQERVRTGRPPTVREVQEAFGFRAVESARAHLEALVADGRLTKQVGKSRGYGLPEDRGPPTILVPLIGRVQAGALTTALQEPEGFLQVSARRPDDELFALRVRGESMKEAGILPDDLVVVRRQSTAVSGDIVVALVGEEATVKRLQLRRGRVELHPANPSFEILVPDEVSILGKVIEVRRHLEEPPGR